MRLLTTIILLPFVLAFSFFKVLMAAAQAFRLGMKGNIYCKHCETPIHVSNSIFGFCSMECASFNDDVLDIVTHEAPHEAEDEPEWKTLSSPSSAKLKDFSVYLDQHGQIYLEDFGTGEPLLKSVGNDGYLLQTAD